MLKKIDSFGFERRRVMVYFEQRRRTKEERERNLSFDVSVEYAFEKMKKKRS
jgi:hypothetical protein